ncbi:UDP-N-acetylmuramoyl-tripeptide--D-alanyl-D-alanine ligase [Candidatus Parcubacteria bacterium]|nr:MAG: UDP-N-acetylmuramoyl-tripeptide--D-alanyl-D-alanine ligase [Candidatus Parcubacteria bacterium]
MKKFLYLILKVLAKIVINKYRPKVVAITGSVGKTSAKEAIASVLQARFSVYRNSKNYNNEVGLPLTILGVSRSGGKNVFRWLYIFIYSLKIILFKDKEYPQVLILEMGADKPGDINYLTSIAKPDLAVITAIGHSHMEFFGSLENIVKEKSSILARLKNTDWAIINGDDNNLSATIKNCQSKIKTFGQNETNEVRISDIKISKRGNQYGTSFKLIYGGSSVPMFLPAVLGWQHAQAAASGAAVALALGMNLVEVGESLQNYQSARGRTNLILGVKNSFIIDDTYNSSPQSSKAALEILAEMPSSGRKIVVFGDMLELGAVSEQAHKAVGKKLVELKIDYLFVVGERSRDIARGAKAAGMSEDKIYHFPHTMEAGAFLQERLKAEDIILIKGSRGAKMEQVVYEIMAKPWLADELLVGSVSK